MPRHKKITLNKYEQSSAGQFKFAEYQMSETRTAPNPKNETVNRNDDFFKCAGCGRTYSMHGFHYGLRHKSEITFECLCKHKTTIK